MMADERQAPGPGPANNDRIVQRGYEGDFARFPPEETDEQLAPGAGPHGTVTTGGTNIPLVVVAIGLVLIFATFAVDSLWPLAVGVVLVLLGGVWGGFEAQRSGGFMGSGTTTVSRDEKS